MIPTKKRSTDYFVTSRQSPSSDQTAFSLCSKLSANEHSPQEHTLFHPSGDPTPSDDDIVSTKQLVEAGRILDIELVDHIIIGHQRFVSLKEHLRWE